MNQFNLKHFDDFDWSFSSWRFPITFRPQLVFHIWYMYHDSDTLLVDTLYSGSVSFRIIPCLVLNYENCSPVAEAYSDAVVAKK